MKLIIAGAMGRMGRTLVRHVAVTPEVALAGITARIALQPEAHAFLHRLGLDALPVAEQVADLLTHADGVIDFTSPAHSLQIAQAVAEQGKVHICGTTGFTPVELQQLGLYATTARMVLAPNMSVGVTLLKALVQKTAQTLGVEYDIEITEMHHRHKADAPSGTALALGDAAAKGRGVALENVVQHGRHGIIGAREQGSIGFAVSRGGDVIGDHTVIFAGSGERIELTHKASARDIYASGAVRAALWANQQAPGLYGMPDVLGL